MKKIIGFSVITLAMFTLSCNTNNDESIDIARMSEELTLKSAEIAVAEVAVTECNYDLEFFTNALSFIPRIFFLDGIANSNNML